MKVLGKCQLREVVQGKEEGLNSSGTLLRFIKIHRYSYGGITLFCKLVMTNEKLLHSC
jgi:hypothetical protein